jgi:pyruvate/2-oxoacid:ferredoxin oxidoreductase alpha subunit
MLRIRQLRPFPAKELLSYVKKNIKYGVLDRNLSPGTGGVFTQEIQAVMNRNGNGNKVYEFIAGLGGRDITSANIEEIFGIIDQNGSEITHWIGLRR